ncbi:MAG: polysaccharide pyruvyl transferase family protein [Sulfitobacter sp.]
MKIAIFNVIYSENLGDGLLAQSLAQQIEACAEARGTPIQIQTIDIAGRTGFSTGFSAGSARASRTAALKLLSCAPPKLRRAIVGRAMRRRMMALRPQWAQTIAHSDAVVIGGGNLFQDDDLNFPTKLGAVIDLATAQGKPLAIYGVGVGAGWSAPAAALFGKIGQADLIYASVRDARSQENWQAQLPQITVPKLVPDPALGLRAPKGARPVPRNGIGLCVTAPVVLRRHASGDAALVFAARIKDYVTLAQTLLARGRRLTLFSNGAREDEAAIAQILTAPPLEPFLRRGQLLRAPRPLTPAHLLAIIADKELIIAHRLHACIAAVALRVRVIGIDWDHKVGAFFASIDQSAACLSAGTTQAEADLRIAQMLGADGPAVDPAPLSAASRRAVGDLCAHLAKNAALR